MSEKFNREIIGIGGGLAAVELSPEIVNTVFEGLEKGTGTDITFVQAEIPALEAIEGNLVEFAQDIALPLATLLLIWAGLKEMSRGITQKEKGKKYG